MLQDEPGFVRHKISRISKDSGYPAQYQEFLVLVVLNGLYHYVAHKIECQPDLIHKKNCRKLLQYAVCSWSSPIIGEHRLSSNMVDLLMQNGADPNQIYQDESAWEFILEMAVQSMVYFAEDNSSELLKIVQIFIENGAIVNKEIYEKISRAVEPVFPGETKRVQDLMVAKGALKGNNRSKVIIPHWRRYRRRPS